MIWLLTFEVQSSKISANKSNSRSDPGGKETPMARQMMHNTTKLHSQNMVSYFAEMARFFAGFYWYAYFCSRYRKPAEST